MIRPRTRADLTGREHGARGAGRCFTHDACPPRLALAAAAPDRRHAPWRGADSALVRDPVVGRPAVVARGVWRADLPGRSALALRDPRRLLDAGARQARGCLSDGGPAGCR